MQHGRTTGRKKTSRRRGGSWKSTGDVVRRCRLEEGEYGGGSSGGRAGGGASRSYLVMRGQRVVGSDRPCAGQRCGVWISR